MSAAEIFSLFPATFLSFLVAFSLGAVFWIAGLVVVSFITPHAELKLLRAGNLPCALAFGGKALGMVLPIAAVARTAAGPLDQIIWCIVAVAVQLVVHLILTTLLEGRLKEEIAADQLGGAAVFVAFMQVGAGVLNNAVMSG
jgi:putative membrane protein